MPSNIILPNLVGPQTYLHRNFIQDFWELIPELWNAKARAAATIDETVHKKVLLPGTFDLYNFLSHAWLKRKKEQRWSTPTVPARKWYLIIWFWGIGFACTFTNTSAAASSGWFPPPSSEEGREFLIHCCCTSGVQNTVCLVAGHSKYLLNYSSSTGRHFVPGWMFPSPCVKALSPNVMVLGVGAFER